MISGLKQGLDHQWYRSWKQLVYNLCIQLMLHTHEVGFFFVCLYLFVLSLQYEIKIPEIWSISFFLQRMHLFRLNLLFYSNASLKVFSGFWWEIIKIIKNRAPTKIKAEPAETGETFWWKNNREKKSKM